VKKNPRIHLASRDNRDAAFCGGRHVDGWLDDDPSFVTCGHCLRKYDAEFLRKDPVKIAVGRYARVTDTARIDYIGKVVAHTGCGVVVRIPNFTADGMDYDWNTRWENVERSTAKACREAAAKR
jgi:hypothetical protein